MKHNVALSFIKRVFYLSDSKFRSDNISKIKTILLSNNYPIQYIRKLINQVLYTYKKSKLNITNDTTKIIHGTITHIPKLTENICKTLTNKNSNIRIANKLNNTTNKMFTNLKDKISKGKTEGVVYKIPCQCDVSYIGETSKSLDTRIKQHMDDVRLTRNKKVVFDAQQNNKDDDDKLKFPLNQKSALVKHSIQSDHNFKFENVEIIDKEKITHKRKFKEACHIWLNTNTVNYKVDTEKLHTNYINIIKNFFKI